MMDHDTRVRVLRQIVDEASYRLILGKLTLPDAERLSAQVRNQARLLLPEQMETYDLIYQSRLSRLIDQFVRPNHLA